jgi:hypothetical protein
MIPNDYDIYFLDSGQPAIIEGGATVMVVFDAGSTTFDLGNDGVVVETKPQAILRSTDAAAIPVKSRLSIGGNQYQVTDAPMPDGKGLTGLMLRKL